MANVYTQKVCNGEKGYHVWDENSTLCQCGKMTWELSPHAYPTFIKNEEQDEGAIAIYRRLGK